MIRTFNAQILKDLVEKKIKSGVRIGQIPVKIGVSRQHLWNWMDGKYDPSADSLAKVANYFGVSINRFFS